MKGPLDFDCPHCQAAPGAPCRSTWNPTALFAPDGKPGPHLLRIMHAHSAAKADDPEFQLTVEEWMRVVEQRPAPPEDELAGLL